MGIEKLFAVVYSVFSVVIDESDESYIALQLSKKQYYEMTCWSQGPFNELSLFVTQMPIKIKIMIVDCT